MGGVGWTGGGGSDVGVGTGGQCTHIGGEVTGVVGNNAGGVRQRLEDELWGG